MWGEERGTDRGISVSICKLEKWKIYKHIFFSDVFIYFKWNLSIYIYRFSVDFSRGRRHMRRRDISWSTARQILTTKYLNNRNHLLVKIHTITLSRKRYLYHFLKELFPRQYVLISNACICFWNIEFNELHL